MRRCAREAKLRSGIALLGIAPYLRPVLAACVLALALPGTAQADKPSNHFTTTSALGDQDFADGSFPNSVAFSQAQGGEPYPFGRFLGADGGGSSFEASWNFRYPVATLTSATLRFGMYDHDSAAPGDQVSLFFLDSVNLTSLANALFNAPGVGGNGEYNVITLPLPDSALADLSDGSATFFLILKGPNCGVTSDGSCPGGGTFNGAAVDFATLTLDQVFVRTIPEPSQYALWLGGLGLLGLVRRSQVSYSRSATGAARC